MMIFYTFTILIIFQHFGTIICRNFDPNNELTTLNPCHIRSNISKTYAFNCTHFFECHHGSKVIKACGPGTVFDPENGICNWPSYVPQCSNVFEHENSIEESKNQYNDKSENTLNSILPSTPDQSQWNINQNQQFINNIQKPVEFTVSSPSLPSQYGHQNPGVQPNILTTGNGNNLQNHLIFVPAPTTQSPYYDLSQSLIFSNKKPVSSENQQNGNRVLELQQINNNKYRPISSTIDNSNRPGNQPTIGQSNPGQFFTNNNQNYLPMNYGKQPTGNEPKYPVYISKPSEAKNFPKLEPMPLNLFNESPSKFEKKPQPLMNNNQYFSNGHQPFGNGKSDQFAFENYQNNGNDYFVPQPAVDQFQQNNGNYQSIHDGREKRYGYTEELPQKENYSGYQSQVQSNNRFLSVNNKPDYEQNLVYQNKNQNYPFNQVDANNNNKQFQNEEDSDGRGDIDIRI